MELMVHFTYSILSQLFTSSNLKQNCGKQRGKLMVPLKFETFIFRQSRGKQSGKHLPPGHLPAYSGFGGMCFVLHVSSFLRRTSLLDLWNFPQLCLPQL